MEGEKMFKNRNFEIFPIEVILEKLVTISFTHEKCI